MQLRVLTCVGVEFESVLFGHFIDHVLSLGVLPGRIHAIVHVSRPDAPGFGAAEAVAAARGLPPPRRWVAPYTSAAMWAERRLLQRDVCAPGDWVLNADVDEHHEYPAPLDAILAHCDRRGLNVVQGVMIDRLAPGGRLAAVAAAPALARQFPLLADLAIPLFGRVRGRGLGGTLKVMLHRADIYPRQGGHDVDADGAVPRYLTGARLAELPGIDVPAQRFRAPFRVHHYKWTAARLPKIERRVSTPGASAMGRRFGAMTAEYLAEHGRIRLRDVAVAPAGLLPVRRHWRLWAQSHRLRAHLRRAMPALGSGRVRHDP